MFEGRAEGRLRAIVFDCARPSALARFWAEALGYHIRPYRDEDLAALRSRGVDDVADDPAVAVDPPRPGDPTLWFNLVPENKVAKNRVHLDIDVARADDVDRLVELGARVLRPLGEVPDEQWVVMADPEGNEFCVFPPQAGG